MSVHIAAIGTAVPQHDVHRVFYDWADARVDPGSQRLFRRMAKRAGIDHRWSVLSWTELGGSPIDAGGFYADAEMPGTAARMAVYAREAPLLALKAIDALANQVPIDGITHLVVASCTGFVAPGVDQIIARRLGLSPSVERLLIGFMGCYAAVTALRSARHIVRAEQDARVLVVTVELSTLHLQPSTAIEPLLAMLQFGDGAAAALVTGVGPGLAIGKTFSAALPESDTAIRWDITDRGFVMQLSGEVPRRIADAIADPSIADTITGGRPAAAIEGWAVHAGGRSILDAVESGFGLPPATLDESRGVLADNGNMSSATLMFVLARMMAGPPMDGGVALAFGPGLAAEGFAFRDER